MEASGVGVVRVGFEWSEAQPYASWSDVPASRHSFYTSGPGGVPTDYRFTDRIVGLAARHDLTVLPVVTYAPAWDGSPAGNHVQPARDRPYASYLRALVMRYGPRGTFWASNPGIPRRPITSWQVWNEPELSTNWNTFPFADSYVRLLRIAHDAIKRADPSARVVLAALTNFGWRDLASIYNVSGSRALFYEVASNPYTAKPSGVITILGKFRQVMDQHGDRAKPMVATEVGWPSALGKSSQNFGINTTERGQARKLSQLLPMLASNRRRLGLAGFFYYTWVTPDPPHGGPFAYAGLLRLDQAKHRIVPKPAYWAFRRAVRKLEG